MSSIPKKGLYLDWASHKAAEYAVTKWHYSKVLPRGKLLKIGVWEDSKFIGVIIFSRGASPFLGKKYNLTQKEVCELTRVALDKHKAPVSQILSKAIRMLKKQSPGLELIISFADPKEGHLGGIYKAGNWIYTGRSNPVIEYFIKGRWRHTRRGYNLALGKDYPVRETPGKFRYIYPLNKKIKKEVLKNQKPFPNSLFETDEK